MSMSTEKCAGWTPAFVQSNLSECVKTFVKASEEILLSTGVAPTSEQQRIFDLFNSQETIPFLAFLVPREGTGREEPLNTRFPRAIPHLDGVSNGLSVGSVHACPTWMSASVAEVGCWQGEGEEQKICVLAEGGEKVWMKVSDYHQKGRVKSFHPFPASKPPQWDLEAGIPYPYQPQKLALSTSEYPLFLNPRKYVATQPYGDGDNTGLATGTNKWLSYPSGNLYQLSSDKNGECSFSLVSDEFSAHTDYLSASQLSQASVNSDFIPRLISGQAKVGDYLVFDEEVAEVLGARTAPRTARTVQISGYSLSEDELTGTVQLRSIPLREIKSFDRDPEASDGQGEELTTQVEATFPQDESMVARYQLDTRPDYYIGISDGNLIPDPYSPASGAVIQGAKMNTLQYLSTPEKFRRALSPWKDLFGGGGSTLLNTSNDLYALLDDDPLEVKDLVSQCVAASWKYPLLRSKKVEIRKRNHFKIHATTPQPKYGDTEFTWGEEEEDLDYVPRFEGSTAWHYPLEPFSLAWPSISWSDAELEHTDLGDGPFSQEIGLSVVGERRVNCGQGIPPGDYARWHEHVDDSHSSGEEQPEPLLKEDFVSTTLTATRFEFELEAQTEESFGFTLGEGFSFDKVKLYASLIFPLTQPLTEEIEGNQSERERSDRNFRGLALARNGGEYGWGATEHSWNALTNALPEAGILGGKHEVTELDFGGVWDASPLTNLGLDLPPTRPSVTINPHTEAPESNPWSDARIETRQAWLDDPTSESKAEAYAVADDNHYEYDRSVTGEWWTSSRQSRSEYGFRGCVFDAYVKLKGFKYS